jgi:thiamine biosynthesis lipoprotein
MRRSAAGLAAILTLTVTVRGGWQDPQERPVPRVATPALVERSAYLMGTRVRLLTWADSRFDGLARLEHALTTLEQTEAELSTWRDDSAIAALNRSPVGSPWSASPAICRMFAVLSDWQTTSGGAFDPSIGRLIQAWDVHGQGRIPSPADLAQARASSGFRHLDFDAVRCTVTRRADVAIDVGAFGKGEALDRVEQRLGDEPWMVDFGGQVSVHGVPPGRGEWPVSIAHPLDRQRAYVEVGLRAGSLSTSAGSERDLFVNGRRIGHHLDPRTGVPAAFGGSVTVWHRRALVADIMSTALFVMGPDEGLRWAESRGIAACYLIPDTNREVSMRATTAFRRSVLFSLETAGR